MDRSSPKARPEAAPAYPNLDRIITDLRDLRVQSHRNRYRGGAPPPLPSRRATVEILEGLLAALFPRHFGTPGPTDESRDSFVAKTLTASLRALEHQIRLELELNADEDASEQDLAGRAFDITSDFAAALPVIRALLETDIQAAYFGDPAARSVDEVMCCYPGVAAIIHHRLAHGLHRLGARMLARIISEVAHAATGIDIHPSAQIGESFFIDHGTGVVVGGTAIIGDRVRLYQAVTLGARRFEVDETGELKKDYPRHPIIEDDVVIYAGATVLGRITVGKGSVIAGNVWLTHSVPPGSAITQATPRKGGFDDGAGT
jgi:serine O-acetyltransferase